VAGDKQLCSQFNRIRKQLLTQKRDAVELKTSVCDMREKMRSHRMGSAAPGGPKGQIDLKQSPGGIVDIEFLVQYLILKHAHEFPDIIKWTDNIRLMESLETHSILSAIQREQLQTAYILMRQAIHHLNLKEKSLKVSDDQFKESREQVKQIYDLFLKDQT
jgi:glutamate-ammonia-ligase adenylyltransferase